MFQSGGSSSNLYFRRKWPTCVIRRSPPTVRGGPLVPSRMDRNLSKRKHCPLRPTRLCEKTIGEPVSRNMPAAITSRNGDSRSSAMADRQLSIHWRSEEHTSELQSL